MAEVLLFQPAMSIVDRIVCSVIDEFKLRRVSHKDLQTLKNKLIYLQAFIHNAGSQNYAEKRAIVNLWLKKVMDVAYYVEDVLVEYAYDGHQRKVEGRFVLYRSLTDFSVSNPIAFRIRMANKVNRATAMFEEIFKEAQNLGIKPGKLTENEWNLPTPAYEEFREEREFASYISGYVGRKYDELKLVKMLSNPSPENKISIVAIVGIGGLGKTTLARRVYDSVTIKEHFARRVWICVSKTFSVTRLLNEMVESLTRNRCGVSNVEATKRVLQNELEGQKYLLVLDDVWNTGQGRWESLMSSLYGIGGSLGSTILFTTRSHEVVETVQAPTVHELQRLSEEAQLLTSEKDAQKWKSIEQSEIWELPQDRFGILPSLLLSFYHLPSSVKQCFSYCAIFKKDTVMSKNDLIRLWLAQGLLHQTSRGTSAEDIGEEYFNMLLGNSFLQFKSRNYLSLDIKCTMHDLVHDMAILVCQTDCLIWKEENEIEDVFGVRHLALIGENLETVSVISTK